MSLEMAQKVIVPQKKNYVPQFLKQRDINSYTSHCFLLQRNQFHVAWVPLILSNYTIWDRLSQKNATVPVPRRLYFPALQ